ncbi:MAG TPA: hypothetical protein VFM02_04465 [Candidatus Paceibacterota bacterium]|nr:hypothetical protein [Candidatus Paceibacterota bacterium]
MEIKDQIFETPETYANLAEECILIAFQSTLRARATLLQAYMMHHDLFSDQQYVYDAVAKAKKEALKDPTVSLTQALNHFMRMKIGIAHLKISPSTAEHLLNESEKDQLEKLEKADRECCFKSIETISEHIQKVQDFTKDFERPFENFKGDCLRGRFLGGWQSNSEKMIQLIRLYMELLKEVTDFFAVFLAKSRT